MKKVIALALAVLMLTTLALAIPNADVNPNVTFRIGRERGSWPDNGVPAAVANRSPGVSGRQVYNLSIIAENEKGQKFDITGKATSGGATGLNPNPGIETLLLRSVNSTNYSLTNVKYSKGGKGLLAKVEFDDAEDAVKIKLNDDLSNTSEKDFEVEFKLKGKVKFTVRDTGEGTDFRNNAKANTTIDTSVGEKISLPDVKFTVVGNVGYGKIAIDVAGDDIDEIDQLEDYLLSVNNSPIVYDRDHDIITFRNGSGTARQAGNYTADAMLTEEFYDGDTGSDLGLTLEARVYAGDKLYLGLDNDPDGEIVKRLADVSADIDFFYFHDNKDYVKFNSNARVLFENADEDCYVYEVKNNKLYPFGEYSEDDGCWVGTTRTLGKYVVSTEALTLLEGDPSEDPSNANPDTGANDVVGIATALAAVALVSAAAISLKK